MVVENPNRRRRMKFGGGGGEFPKSIGRKPVAS